MITKHQYLRLCGVLSIPLLMLGFWTSRNEIIFGHHVYTICLSTEQRDPTFRCIQSKGTRDEYDDARNRSSVTVDFVTLLFVSYPVAVYMRDVTKGGPPTTAPRAAKQSLLSLKQPSTGQWTSPCNLTKWAKNVWGYSCLDMAGGYYTSFFDFADDQTATKFNDLFEQDFLLRKENLKLSKWLFTGSVLAPIGAFLLLSAAILMLIKAYRFVISKPAK